MFMNVQHVVNNDRCTTNPTFSGEQQLLLGGWLFGGLLEGQPQLLKTSFTAAAATKLCCTNNINSYDYYY